MAETLSVQIALEGGKEIESQLEDIGAAGKKAFNDISTAAAKVGGFDNLDPGVATKKMEEFGVTGEASINKIIDAVKKASIMETFVNGVKAVEAAFVKMGTAVEKVITIMAKHEAASIGLGRAGVAAASAMLAAFGPLGVTIGLVAVAVGVGLVAAFVAATKAIQEADAAAIKLGLTFAQFDKLKQSMQAAGISTKAFADGMAHLQAVTEQVKLDAVNNALKDAQQNIAKGWPAATENIRILIDTAKGIGPAAEAARKALETLGQPIDDNIKKTFESILRATGSLADAIPAIGKELSHLPTAADRFALMKKGIDEVILAADKAGKSALPDLVTAFSQLPPTVERNRLILATLGDTLGTELIQVLRLGGTALDQFKTKLAGSTGQTQEAADAATRLNVEWEKFKALVFPDAPVTELNAMATALGAIRELLTVISNIPAPKFSDTVREIQAVWDAMKAVADFGVSMWDGIVQGAKDAWGKIIGWINDAIEAVRTFIGMGSGAAAATPGQGGIGSAASGGLIGGRGTGTSDSNLAWVSRGEHIMPARAVQQPGVLAFLEALRRTGGDLHGLLNGMGHFALGGLVSAPAFAGGGLNSMSHVTIAFPGLPPIGGLRASASVVTELQHAAAMAQVRSGGRKPSRYF